MKMFLISDNVDTQTGMRLAGVEGVVAHTREEVCHALENVLADKEIGILLVTVKLSSSYPVIFKEIKLTQKTPLVVDIPDRHGPRSFGQRYCRIYKRSCWSKNLRREKYD